MTCRLVYVDEPWAWFTTLDDISKQWGDDWNDAPYEHNAGEPYGWHIARDLPEYGLLKVAYDGDLETPRYGHLNSMWSVQQINAGAIAWLRTPSYVKQQVAIPAGTEYPEFVYLVEKAGGSVYVAPRNGAEVPHE